MLNDPTRSYQTSPPTSNSDIGSLSTHVSKCDSFSALSLASFASKPHPDFGSIHFNKNIEDYLLKLMCCCCAHLPWLRNNGEKNWWNWNLHRKTYEFFTSFCEYENFISSCAARLLSSTVLLLLANDRFIFFPLNGKQFYWSFVCKSCFQNGLGVEFNLCEVNIRFHARTLFLEHYNLKFH